MITGICFQDREGLQENGSLCGECCDKLDSINRFRSQCYKNSSLFLDNLSQLRQFGHCKAELIIPLSRSEQRKGHNLCDWESFESSNNLASAVNDGHDGEETESNYYPIIEEIKQEIGEFSDYHIGIYYYY